MVSGITAAARDQNAAHLHGRFAAGKVMLETKIEGGELQQAQLEGGGLLGKWFMLTGRKSQSHARCPHPE